MLQTSNLGFQSNAGEVAACPVTSPTRNASLVQAKAKSETEIAWWRRRETPRRFSGLQDCCL